MKPRYQQELAWNRWLVFRIRPNQRPETARLSHGRRGNEMRV